MNHKKVVIVAVALVALLAIAGIGAAYAYTATTQNTGNSTDPGFMTIKLSNLDGSYAYTSSFDSKIMFDTETVYTAPVVDPPTPAKEEIKYTIADESIDGKVLSQTNNAVVIGEVYLNIDYSNVNDNYVIEMDKSAGTISDNYVYYVGYKSGASRDALGSETFELYDPANGCVLGAFGSDNSVKAILVTLYVTEIKQTTFASNVNFEQPLKNVAFKFTSKVVGDADLAATLVTNDADLGTVSLVGPQNVYAGQTQRFSYTEVGGHFDNIDFGATTPLYDIIGDQIVIFVNANNISGTVNFEQS